ncbi:MAG TPA: disulfide bond formation protein B [Stellaceae bacterium]|jgi:disulfide bond formation protein DsbB|nr:disulfide bond formation protein B [Stellaceae bacterium]
MVRAAPLSILVLSVAVVGAALLSQYWGGLLPCELCLYERWPYYAVALLALFAVAVGRRNTSRAALALAGLVFVAGAALAFYHAGVEWHWFAGPTACTGLALDTSSVAALRVQLLATPPVRCDAVQWSLFGISLAGWNFVASVILAALSWAAVTRLRQAA